MRSHAGHRGASSPGRAERRPASADKAADLAETSHWTRRYAEAVAYYDTAIHLSPDWDRPYVLKAGALLAWEGRVDRALEAMTARGGPAPSGAAPFRVVGDRMAGLLRVDRDTAGSLLATARLALDEKRFELARARFDSARTLLRARMSAYPDDATSHYLFALACVGLGEQREGSDHAEQALRLLPASVDAMGHASLAAGVARLWVEVGEHDRAIAQLEYLLSAPSPLSTPMLRLDPLYDPLRGRPRFEALLAKHANPKPVD